VKLLQASEISLPRAWRNLFALVLAASTGACAYHGLGSVDEYYQTYKARMPERDKVFVCSAYGCRTQTPFRFNESDIAQLKKLMTPARNTPADERHAVSVTLAWMSQRVGDVVGTSADRPADDLAGSGDPTQMDCVDIALNLTSYMLILERHGLLHHHTVGALYVKEDLRRGWSGWPHYAGILVANDGGQRYAVDGWKMASGQPPEIVETQKWYIDDGDIMFGGKNKDAVPAGEPAADAAPAPPKPRRGPPLTTSSLPSR
jgi:hypothetical protein